MKYAVTGTVREILKILLLLEKLCKERERRLNRVGSNLTDPLCLYAWLQYRNRKDRSQS